MFACTRVWGLDGLVGDMLDSHTARSHVHKQPSTAAHVHHDRSSQRSLLQNSRKHGGSITSTPPSACCLLPVCLLHFARVFGLFVSFLNESRDASEASSFSVEVKTSSSTHVHARTCTCAHASSVPALRLSTKAGSWSGLLGV